MKYSRLKNIINKSKGVSNDSPFDKFKKSLPIEVNDSYRLESAWKAYGKPKDFKEAIWYGMILPTGDLEFRLPSIGYNEETDEYEYLNKGKDNETVNKDIRVWDNNVIPLVKELKSGGYIRTFNEEKDCWTYSKNKSQATSDKLEEPQAFKQGGQMNLIPDGALHARKNNMELAEDGEVTHKGIPVIDNLGQLQAEIERNEIILNLTTTLKVEKFYKEYTEEMSLTKKDDIAIECGKMLAKSIIEDTEDKTNLILEVANK